MRQIPSNLGMAKFQKHRLRELIFITAIFANNISFAEEKLLPAPLKIAEEKLTTPPLTHPIDNKKIFSFIYENDVFNNEDNGYTNGIRLAWTSAERPIFNWAQEAANKIIPTAAKGKKRTTMALGQSIFTPQNLSDPNLIKNDRPYAGWLYSSYGIMFDTGKTLDNFILTLGVVGPLSGAEQTQEQVHKIVNGANPQGWSHQLHNELGINLTYEKKWRSILEYSSNKFGFDVIPEFGFNLGNINTSASLGSVLRIGYDLPLDYGPPRIRPSLPGSDFFLPTNGLGGYFFVGFQGRAVARNIFLDGNSIQASASVHKKPLLGDMQIGAAITHANWRVTYAQIFLTKEFYGQIRPQKYGTLSVSYRY